MLTVLIFELRVVVASVIGAVCCIYRVSTVAQDANSSIATDWVSVDLPVISVVAEAKEVVAKDLLDLLIVLLELLLGAKFFLAHSLEVV